MTKIEWTHMPGFKGETWNVSTGCSKVSPGCKHCYAERMWPRLCTGRAFTDVRFHPERLEQPPHWRKPRMVFVCSMSDLFHPALTNEQIAAVFGVMAACPQHRFIVLTKRPARMLEWFEWEARWSAAGKIPGYSQCDEAGVSTGWYPTRFRPWPLSNVWLLVSVEDQATADERIPLLLKCPAAVRGVSLEPMLAPVDLERIDIVMAEGRPGAWTNALTGQLHVVGTTLDRTQRVEVAITEPPRPRVDWVIVGAESGPKARECRVEWIESIAEQCKVAEVACFIKQIHRIQFHSTTGARRVRLSKDPSEWPKDLRTREWPNA